MGFLTGLIGGTTLTLGLAYLSADAHHRNRRHQAALLHTQTQTLQLFLTSPSYVTRTTCVDDSPRPRLSFVETLKSRWNEEITQAIMGPQRTDWRGVRASLNDVFRTLLRRVHTMSGDRSTNERLEEDSGTARGSTREGKTVAMAMTSAHSSNLNRGNIGDPEHIDHTPKQDKTKTQTRSDS